MLEERAEAGTGEVMVDLMTWLGGGESVGGEHVQKLREQLLDTQRSGEELGAAECWNGVGRSMDDNVFRTWTGLAEVP